MGNRAKKTRPPTSKFRWAPRIRANYTQAITPLPTGDAFIHGRYGRLIADRTLNR